MRKLLNRRGVIAVGLCMSLALAASACGDDGDDGGEPQAAAQPIQVTVTAQDFKFDAPASVEAGLVEITLNNEGKAPHQVQLLKLNEGVEFADFEQIVKTDRTGQKTLENSTPAGGVTAIVPGATATVANELDAGTYALVCFVQGHHTQGMIAELEVTAAEGVAAEPPATDGEITLKDFEITLPEGFSGEGTFEVSNDGPAPHEMDVFKVNASVEDVEKFLEDPKGPPPGGEPEGQGGAGAIAAGSSAFIDLNLEPGVYVFACFVPDEKGRPHFSLGMHDVVEITG
ncbi:MAG: hypothetical protein M3238_08990 [Actinomycetota bacterium]|nr:hypothetical protein [Actinomycetota bacterium]